jgi:AcrR family transcriptional regulator
MRSSPIRGHLNTDLENVSPATTFRAVSGRYPPYVNAMPRTAPWETPLPGESLAFRAACDGDAEITRTQATPAGAFRAARRMFLHGRRLDMGVLATELGISRTTLYRWTGHRDQLLADVLWSLSDEIFEQAKAAQPEHLGTERLLAIFRQHVGVLMAAEPLHIFLHQETHAALRILTSPEGGVQPRTVWKVAELYREEQEAGAFQPRIDPGALAYAVVRVTEGFIYHDAIATIEPKLERAARIVALLLE